MKGTQLFDQESFRSSLFLTDGGVYDNLGLEAIWDRYQTVLVSDAGVSSWGGSEAFQAMGVSGRPGSRHHGRTNPCITKAVADPGVRRQYPKGSLLGHSEPH